jgi:hypothetical protein
VDYTNKQIEDLLTGIFEGEITEQDLPEDLYIAIANYLKSGLYKGYGMSLETATGRDLELLTELRENIYMFSGAKTYSQVLEMVELVAKSESYKEFHEGAVQVYDLYNKTWLKTEYDTAIGQAQMAVKWTGFEKNKDILPMLIYSTIGDACDICAPLDGFAAPVDDPAWNSICPLNHFHCECLIIQDDSEANKFDISEVEEKMDDDFKMNPGKDGYIFKDTHPYFEVAKGDRGLAQQNFDLPIPEND